MKLINDFSISHRDLLVHITELSYNVVLVFRVTQKLDHMRPVKLFVSMTKHTKYTFVIPAT